jgi:hypothetical protein
LEDSIREKVAEERKRMGMTADIEATKSMSLGKTTSKTSASSKKMMPGP